MVFVAHRAHFSSKAVLIMSKFLLLVQEVWFQKEEINLYFKILKSFFKKTKRKKKLACFLVNVNK